jgi:hypothetical protein
MCITENETRGGVVMEDLSEVVVDLPCDFPMLVGCQCWGDIADAIGNPPGDLIVDLGDLTAMVNAYIAVGAPYDIGPPPPGLECMDVGDAIGQPGHDGNLDLGDLTALVNYLIGVGSPYSGPCIP